MLDLSIFHTMVDLKSLVVEKKRPQDKFVTHCERFGSSDWLLEASLSPPPSQILKSLSRKQEVVPANKPIVRRDGRDAAHYCMSAVFGCFCQTVSEKEAAPL